jgi:nucleoside-diphosphate-sugar epimerase
MPTAIVTGSGGLIGSESAQHFLEQGYDVVGLENDSDRPNQLPLLELDSRLELPVDHRWWISDLAPFRRDYSEWEIIYDLDMVLREIYEQNADRWLAAR